PHAWYNSGGAVVLHHHFKISSPANEDILRWHLQYICSEKPFFALLRNRLYFADESPLLCKESAFRFFMARG
ncbi:MAG: hypothetical protein J6R54_03595, partial [Bacteroidaceae bacterium]|nr:hypothetical protein [Bacteroidaceae bacterium]